MQTAVEDGPVELAGVLLHQEVGLALAVEQAEGLAVGADKDHAAAGINLGARKVANFSPTDSV